MKSCEVLRVANGYMVRPDRGWQMANNSPGDPKDIHVFSTWTEASKWLRDSFEVDTGTQNLG